jgi:hypothetical protein
LTTKKSTTSGSCFGSVGQYVDLPVETISHPVREEIDEDLFGFDTGIIRYAITQAITYNESQKLYQNYPRSLRSTSLQICPIINSSAQ